jgi:hypothetical protein
MQLLQRQSEGLNQAYNELKAFSLKLLPYLLSRLKLVAPALINNSQL